MKESDLLAYKQSATIIGAGVAATADARSASASSPSLSIRNTGMGGGMGGQEPTKEPAINMLTGAHKRTAEQVKIEVEYLAAKYGVENLAFGTWTFPDDVQDADEAQRRWKSLENNVLRERYEKVIATWERHQSGRIHFHAVIVHRLGDIRSRFSFEQVADKRLPVWQRYISASKSLRLEWAFWRKSAKGYGFGRVEFMPIKSTAEAIARYLGKYISKHVGSRLEQDKGRRLVRYIGYKAGDRRSNNRFSWNTVGGWMWRQKLAIFCAIMGLEWGHLKQVYGSNWCYRIADAVQSVKIDSTGDSEMSYPSLKHFIAVNGACAVADFNILPIDYASTPITQTFIPVNDNADVQSARACDDQAAKGGHWLTAACENFLSAQGSKTGTIWDKIRKIRVA